MTKVLYISHSPYVNGAEMCLLTLLKHLDRTHYEPLVVFPCEGPLVESTRELNIKAYISPLDRWIRYPLDTTPPETAIERRVEALVEIINKEGIDVVHSNTSVIFEGAVAAKKAGIPHVWQVHETLPGHPELTPLLPLPLIFSTMSFLSDRIVTVAEATKAQFGQVVEASKLVTIYNGTESGQRSGKTRASIRKDLGIGEDDFVVVTVGEVSERKGYPAWLETASLLKGEAKFMWAGYASDEALSKMTGLIGSLGLEGTVSYLGFRQDVPDVIEGADLLLLTSINEAFPMVILEAMSAGKPVIATDCGGTRESVIDEVTGFLTPVNDVGTIAERIFQLSQDRELLKQLGKNALELYQEKFSAEINAAQFGELYREVAQSCSNGRFTEKEWELCHAALNAYQANCENLQQMDRDRRELSALRENLLASQVRVTEQENKLIEREHWLSDRDAHISQLDEWLADRDQHIARLDQWLADRDKHIARLDQWLADREQQVNKLCLSLKDKEDQYSQLDELVSQRNRELQRVAESLAEKSDLVESLTAQLEDLDNRLEQKESECCMTLREVNRLRRELTWTTNQSELKDRLLREKLNDVSNSELKYNTLKSQIVLLEEELRKKDEKVQEISRQENLWVTEKCRLEEQIKCCQLTIEEIHASKSWRVTKPMRFVYGQIRSFCIAKTK